MVIKSYSCKVEFKTEKYEIMFTANYLIIDIKKK